MGKNTSSAPLTTSPSWMRPSQFPAIEIAKCFEKMFTHHGAMKAIITDQGREFVNQVFGGTD